MNKIKITALLILSVLIYSCDDFLSPDPISSITTTTFFNDEAELQTAVINMYDGIQGVNFSVQSNANNSIQLEYQLTEMRSDNTRRYVYSRRFAVEVR